MKRTSIILLICCALFSCNSKRPAVTVSGILPSDFTYEAQGKPTTLHVLKNKKGAEACVTNYGARLVSLMVPDREGRMLNVTLGHDSIGKHLNSWDVFGAVIGRFANRIGEGTFTVDGVSYELPHKDDGPAIHGGAVGYHYRVWDSSRQIDGQTAEINYRSVDGEANFPGTLDVKVTYHLTDDNALVLTYEATTDKPTVVNLTNHAYFVLSDNPGTKVLDYEVTIGADHYTPTDHYQVPTGEIAPVENTPFDLRQPVAIGDRINDPHEQMQLGHGFDHNFVLNAQGDIKTLSARVYNPETGIVMEVYTTEPGLQFCVPRSRDSFCLETQHYPDSPNKPNFPSTELRPGEKFFSQTIYKFGVE